MRSENEDIVFYPVKVREKIVKVILFILSAEPDISSPFLIISDGASIFLWESEFRRLAPSINALVYCGSKDARKIIRNFEFYGEDGCIKFQVLLSLPDAIVEDYDALDFFGWEALIVDDCQRFRVSKHLDHLNRLSSDFRLLLLDGQLEDNIGTYLSFLSFLDSGRNQCSVDGAGDSFNCGLTELAFVKERLLKFSTYDVKVENSKYLEYWVPVELSTVQLEQYCANLISHSLSLRSLSKTDHVGALSDALISQHKCCDHPYLVDDFLQARLTKDLPAADYLDVGVKASGKLHLLDRILQEMKNRSHRVVLLFQLVGRDGMCSIGDILDDFLRQRFGADSYERTSLKLFNNKENGRFVFLIENRACLPSIRLSSVDAVIIFSSDWNPASDLRALQRISIDSNFGRVKIFRLYSAFTVEEKALILAKQDTALDSNIRNISCGVSRSLLSWGASHIFSKLDEFHVSESPVICSVSFFEKPILDEVVEELLTHLSQNSGEQTTASCSIISKCQHNGARYSREVVLLGEKEFPCLSEEPPHIFWSELLNGRNPRWVYRTEKSLRDRRRPVCYDSLPQHPGSDNDETRKKCRKVASSNGVAEMPDEKVFTVKSQSSSSQNETMCAPVDLAMGPDNVMSFAKDLHLLLKPELAQLCETLQLSSGISSVAQMFLKYIIDNHRVSQEPETILQAFKISLCWRAASTMKQKLDHSTSLLLARKYLNFQCTEEEAESVYQKLRMLKKKTLLKNYLSRKVDELKSYPERNATTPRKEMENEHSHKKDPASVVCDQGELKEGEICDFDCSQKQISLLQDQIPVSVVPPVGSHLPASLLKDKIRSKRISLIEKTSSKRADKLREKHELEVEEFDNFMKLEGTKHKKAYELELALIHAMDLPSEVRKEKLDFLEQQFSNTTEKFEKHMKTQRKKLMSMQVKAKNKEQKLRECWLAEVNAGKLGELFDNIPLEDTDFTPEKFENVDRPGNFSYLSNVPHVSGMAMNRQRICPISSGQSDNNCQDNMSGSILLSTVERHDEDLPRMRDATHDFSPNNSSNNVSRSDDGASIEEGSVNVTSPDVCGRESRRECAMPSASPERKEVAAFGQPSPSCGFESNLPSQQAGSPEECQLFQVAVYFPTMCQPAGLVPCDGGGRPSVLDGIGSEPLTCGTQAGIDAASQRPNLVLTVSGTESSDESDDVPIQQPKQPCNGLSFQPHVTADLPSCHGNVSQTGESSDPLVSQAAYLTDSTVGMHLGPWEEKGGILARLLHSRFLQMPVSVAMVKHPLHPATPLELLLQRLGKRLVSVRELLLNELGKIRREEEKENEMREKEKHRLKLELEKELDQVRRKYDSLLNEVETTFMERNKLLREIYNKVNLNWVLAEEFRSRFTESRMIGAGAAAQGMISTRANLAVTMSGYT
ncbi:unnamed protein product [Spirodela intermedia]|uniref:Uncharacterized protein n=1 Tax=Spirodela intermedia TaxID=51605 RepID=A0A7I8J8U4_SPIIN|nr:unnamed protein product [Spirodela intermedia]CAA6666441.1 unnamed protein product [Spirodela intermedia]